MSVLRNMLFLLIIAIQTVWFSACNLPKLAGKEGPFLFKNKIVLNGNREAQLLSSDLSDYIKQRPNKRLAGTMRFGLRFYKFGSGFPEKRLGRLMQTTLGEAPVILDSSLIKVSIKGMKNYLRTQGYYYPEITYTVSGRIHKKTVTYHIEANEHFVIRNIEYHIADKNMDSILRANSDLIQFRKGNRLVWEKLLKEKNRTDDILKNNGYFDFNKDFIKFDLDTNIGSYYADVGINISNKSIFDYYKKYRVKSILIEIDQNRKDTLSVPRDSIQMPNFTYIPGSYPLHAGIVNRSLVIQPGSLFNQDRANATFARFSDLRIFKSVNISAQPVNENSDTPEVNYSVRLQPAKKMDFVFEPQAITSDQSNLVSNSTGRNYGLASQISLSINNIFHNAEILKFSYRISIEAQRGPNIPTSPFFNSFESNLTASLTFPKLVFLPKTDRQLINTANRSVVSATTILEQNVDWIRKVYGLSLSYQLSRKTFSYYFSPAEISYIKTDFNSTRLELQSKGDPYLQSVFSNNLVTSMKGGFVYNNQSEVKRKDYTYIKWDVLELAGTFIDMFYKVAGITRSDSGYYTFMGVQYFQYAKTFVDLRFNKYIDMNNRLASRLAVGVALPFGNSPEYVPFDKRFFTGGANSIRAFLPRSIGPGSYNASGNLDRSGDIKIETSLEYRFNIYNHYIEGAVFTDAGNIWKIKDDGREGAVFTVDNFYKQIAGGAGVGLRINLDFLILRMDAAIPVLDPRKPIGKRYVLPTYNDPSNLLKSSILNFGVGYPF